MKRFDKTGVIVRFNLKHCDKAVADIDHAGIFARSLHHMAAARG